MLEFSEAQMVEIVLVAARRGYKQASEDADKRSEAHSDRFAQEGIDAYRAQAIALLRKRLTELKELKANDLLVAGFNEAIEHLEFGVEKEWSKLRGEK
jgi:hypothetical protein